MTTDPWTLGRGVGGCSFSFIYLFFALSLISRSVGEANARPSLRRAQRRISTSLCPMCTCVGVWACMRVLWRYTELWHQTHTENSRCTFNFIFLRFKLGSHFTAHKLVISRMRKESFLTCFFVRALKLMRICFTSNAGTQQVSTSSRSWRGGDHKMILQLNCLNAFIWHFINSNLQSW